VVCPSYGRIISKLFLDNEMSEEGTAATGEGYSSDSSVNTAATSKSGKAAHRDKSKASKARGRSSSRRPPEEQMAETNPCKHCRKHGRHLRHPKVLSITTTAAPTLQETMEPLTR